MTQKNNLRKLAQELGETFRVSEAATVLEISPRDTSKTLSRWEKLGWIKRICKGIYSIVPLDAFNQNQPLENMWILVPEIFSPGYVGGWSAAEYWDLTEQVFKDICVLSEKRSMPTQREFLGVSFFVTHIPKEINFGTEVVWIKNKKVQVSDPHKTILDMLYKTAIGGGIQHTIDCFKVYVKSDKFDPLRLISYARKMGNGVVFKMLGYLSERVLGYEHDLTQICLQEIIKGPSFIDFSLKKGHFISRWNLYVPDTLQF